MADNFTIPAITKSLVCQIVNDVSEELDGAINQKEVDTTWVHRSK